MDKILSQAFGLLMAIRRAGYLALVTAAGICGNPAVWNGRNAIARWQLPHGKPRKIT